MIPLRPFQEVGRDKILQHKGFIIADQMGLGKTRTVLAALEQIITTGPKNVMVICTKNAFATWRKQTGEWLPDIEIIYVRSKKANALKERHAIWDAATKPSDLTRMFICTSAVFRNDYLMIRKKWDIIILDEYDRFMANRSKTYKLLRRVRWNYFIPVSGTPMRKGPQNLWPILNLLAPKLFTSYWRFVETFCNIDDSGFGRQIYGVRNAEDLRELLTSYMVKHLKKDVIPELPEKQRDRLPAEMQPAQAKAYRELEKEMIALIDDNLLMVQNTLELQTRLRQLLCCPKALHPSLPMGGGFEAIVDMMETTSSHSVIFVPFKAPIPLIKAELEKRGFGPIVALQGGLDPDELERRTEIFKEQKGIAIVSILYAQSFELDPCEYAYFLGYLWDSDTNEQAEDRLHRMQVRHFVNIYYIVHENTADQRILELINDSHRNIQQVFGDPEALKNLMVGAKDSS